MILEYLFHENVCRGEDAERNEDYEAGSQEVPTQCTPVCRGCVGRIRRVVITIFMTSS